MGRKLVIIGAGSSYTPELLDGIMQRNDNLNLTRVALVDIPEGIERAGINTDLGRRIFKKNGTKCEIELFSDRRKALKDADFVISQIRVGGYAARILDEKICLDMGIVGQETTGGGGFMCALRTVPVALQIAKDIADVCPDAYLINFTNPSGIVTQALARYSNIKNVGLCNVPINMQSNVAGILGKPFKETICNFVGLNHLSFINSVKIKGSDEELLPCVLEKVIKDPTIMHHTIGKPGIDRLIDTIKLIPSYYLSYFYFENEMFNEIFNDYKQSGQTRGTKVREIDVELFKKYADPNLCEKPKELESRGGSLYSTAALDIVEALLSEDEIELVINVVNNGSIPDLCDEDTVEINCKISKHGIKPKKNKPLSPYIAGLIKTMKQYESLAVDAAVNRDRSQAMGALMNNVLIRGFNNTEKLLDEFEKNFSKYLVFK